MPVNGVGDRAIVILHNVAAVLALAVVASLISIAISTHRYELTERDPTRPADTSPRPDLACLRR